MDHLQFFHRVISIEDKIISKYLNHHMTKKGVYEFEEISASDVDPEK